MEMKINIEIGMTDRLETLAYGLISLLTAKTEATPQPGGSENPDKQENPDNPGQTEIQEPQQPTQPEPQQPENDKIPWEPAEVSDDDLKSAMDIALSRFCGEGWRESGDPKTLAIRKELTRLFKQIAGHMGAEKPTKLGKDARHKFMDTLESIKLGEDGMPEWLPF